MADQSFSRIYQLQTAGVDKVLTDVNAVIARLEVLGQVKNKISNSDIGDPAEVAALNTQYNNLVATVDKMAKSQEGLSDALAQVIELQKGVTMSMKESSVALGENLSAGTAGLTKLQAGMALTKAATDSIAGSAATLSERLVSVKDQIAQITDAMKFLQKEFAEGKITEDEYITTSGQLTTQLIDLRVESQALTQILKMQASAQDAVTGSINEARTTAALYRKELNGLNLTTEEGVARQKELIAQIAELDNFIKSNADLYTRQKINIGNYPSLAAEFSQIKKEMQEIILAGDQTGERFQVLQARALELSAAMKEVGETTKQTASTMDRFGGIVEKMGLRMIANLLIFQAIIEIVQSVGKMIKESSEQANSAQTALAATTANLTNSYTQEVAAIDALRARFNDLKSTEDDKLEVVNELNEKYGNQIDKINGVNEAEAFFVNKSAAFIEALTLRAKATAAMTVMTQLYQKELQLLTDPNSVGLDWADKARAILAAIGDKGKTKEEFLSDVDFEKIAQASGKANKELVSVREQAALLLKQWIELQNKAQALDSKYGFDTDGKAGKDKKEKGNEPHDYLNERLSADRKYYDDLAKLQEAAIQNDQIALKQIYENDHNNLDLRLNAYAIFLNNKKELLELSKKAEIRSDEDKLDVIAGIEQSIANKQAGKSYNKSYFTKNGALGTQEQTLLDNKRNITADIALAKAQLTNGIDEINAEAVSGTTAIVKSSFDHTISDIDDQLTQVKLKINADYDPKENKIIDSKKSGPRKGEQLEKIENRKQMAEDQAEMIADKLKDQATELEFDQAFDNGQVDMAIKLYQKLLSIEDDYLNKKKDLAKRGESEDAKQKSINREAEEAFINVASQYANNYLQLIEKNDAQKQALEARSLDWNKKMLDSEAQSKNEQLTEDKAYYIAQQQLAKEKMQTDKKRAEAQAVIDYASAALSLIPKAIETGGIPSLIIQEAALAAIFFGKEDMLQSAPTYAQGTRNHPGGPAYVGDGGEPELIKIGNRLSISPSTSTLVNLPAGSSVTPFSQLGGNLKAPSFNVSSNTGGDSGLHQTVMALHSSVAAIAMGLSKLQINYDPAKAVRANNNHYYKSVKV